MTTQVTERSARARRLSRSSAAVLLGLFSVFVLSLGTDQVLHVLEVYPPWGQPMYETSLNLLALSYRIVYGIAGGYISARFAPRNPMRHAVVLGVVGLVLGAAGAITAITRWISARPGTRSCSRSRPCLAPGLAERYRACGTPNADHVGSASAPRSARPSSGRAGDLARPLGRWR